VRPNAVSFLGFKPEFIVHRGWPANTLLSLLFQASAKTEKECGSDPVWGSP